MNEYNVVLIIGEKITVNVFLLINVSKKTSTLSK